MKKEHPMKYKRMIYFVSGAACLFLAAGLILYPILFVYIGLTCHNKNFAFPYNCVIPVCRKAHLQ